MYKRFPNDPLINIPFRTKNQAERLLYNILTEDGFKVVKRGYPNFACFREDELILCEVKPNKETHLKPSQYKLMKALSDRGIKCYRWSPDVGFQSIY